MSTPDVRVRLSPEGINEVLHALRELQKESGKTTAAAARGTNLLTGALRDLKSLLPAIGLATVVTGMAAMTRQALATADATGKLQQRVGGTVEELSALSFAFRTNGSDQDGLQRTLAKTAQVMQAVADDSGGMREVLTGIGVDAEALTKLSTPRALEEIANKLAALPPGAQRAATATKIFGQNAVEIIPALVALGVGIDAFIEKASAAGNLIDDELVEAAARARDGFDRLRISAEGVATQLAAGFAPQIAGAMEDFSTAIEGTGLNSFRKFAEFVGFFIRFIVGEFIVLGKVIGANAAAIGVLVRAAGDAVRATARLDFSGAKKSFTDAFATLSTLSEQLEQEKAEIRERVATPVEPRPRGESGAGGVTPGSEAIRQRAAARLALEKTHAQNLLNLQKEQLRRQEEVNKQAFDQGLISLAAFFAKRREIIQREVDLEIAALRAQQQAIVAGPRPENEAERIRQRQQIAELDGRIRQQQAQASRELLALDGQRIEAERDLSRARQQSHIELLELEGRRHEAFQANLAIELENLRRLSVQAGRSASDIGADAARLAAARRSTFEFEEASRKGQAALAAFDRDAEQIRRDQEAGIIMQLEGEHRLIELQRARLETLKQLAAAALVAAQATGSPEAIAQAQAFAASVDQVAASLRAATDIGSQFRTGAVESFQSGVQTLLENADQIESVGDAFKSLARTVLQSLNQIAAEIIAKQATFALLHLFGLSIGGGAPAPGAKRGGLVRGYAGGGDIRAPEIRSLPGPDKIPILAQNGEFILRRARVQERGALDFLRAWNAGAFTLAQAVRFPRYAGGGEIGVSAAARAAGGAGGIDRVRIVNQIGPELVTDAMATASGEKVIVNTITRNATAIRRILQS